MKRCIRALLLTLLAAPIGVHMQAAAAEGGSAGPAVPRLVWRAPQRVRWSLGMTPLWFSVGHAARVVCFVPERAGEAVTAVRVELREVDAFTADGIPADTTKLADTVVRADDPDGLKRRKGWGFPTEQGVDFEFEELPALEHQTLTRLYAHGQGQFWHTLMLHVEADVEELPSGAAGPAGPAKRFAEFRSYTIVCELLRDPQLPLTSTYIEPDDPPSREWLEREPLPAPWVRGKDKLEPARGSLSIDAQGKLVFAALTDAARQAIEEVARRESERAGPKLRIPLLEGGETEDLPELEEEEL